MLGSAIKQTHFLRGRLGKGELVRFSGRVLAGRDRLLRIWFSIRLDARGNAACKAGRPGRVYSGGGTDSSIFEFGSGLLESAIKQTHFLRVNEDGGSRRPVEAIMLKKTKPFAAPATQLRGVSGRMRSFPRVVGRRNGMVSNVKDRWARAGPITLRRRRYSSSLVSHSQGRWLPATLIPHGVGPNRYEYWKTTEKTM